MGLGRLFTTHHWGGRGPLVARRLAYSGPPIRGGARRLAGGVGLAARHKLCCHDATLPADQLPSGAISRPDNMSSKMAVLKIAEPNC